MRAVNTCTLSDMSFWASLWLSSTRYPLDLLLLLPDCLLDLDLHLSESLSHCTLLPVVQCCESQDLRWCTAVKHTLYPSCKTCPAEHYGFYTCCPVRPESVSLQSCSSVVRLYVNFTKRCQTLHASSPCLEADSSMLLSRISLKWSETSRIVVLVFNSGLLVNVSLQSGHWQLLLLSQYPVIQALQKLWPQAMDTCSVKSSRQIELCNCSSRNRLPQEAMPATLRKPHCYSLENISACCFSSLRPICELVFSFP